MARAAEDRAERNERLEYFHGIPYSIKDLEPTAGIRTTFSSVFFRENVPSEDSLVVKRLRTSGGILVGKTNTSHFGYKEMTDNLIAQPHAIRESVAHGRWFVRGRRSCCSERARCCCVG